MSYQKAGDRIRKTATWKQTKQIWMLRTAKSYISKLATIKVFNQDTEELKTCEGLLEQIIDRQIEIK